MKNNCSKWKEPLLEAALTGITSSRLQAHLQACPACTQEMAALRARREQMDALLPLLARASEPTSEFHERVLAAAHARAVAHENAAGKIRRGQPRPVWVLALATPLTALVLLIAIMLSRKTTQPAPISELAMAEKLAQWRAPSDALLATPGQEILQAMPKLGDVYLRFPIKTDNEKKEK